jgi:lipopolysaccharide transport system permease protein
MFIYFFKREINEKYLGNLTGFSWVFIQPIITLLIYYVVFDQIFGARYADSEDISFIVYLAIGFWPWLAFSESVLRSITGVTDKKDLIGKVNIDFKVSVIATISASFLLNCIGYIIILSLIIIFNAHIDFSALPLIIIPLIQLYLLSIALGLLLSSINVFIRDTLQFMTTMMTLWFFMTPIIYSVSILPEKYKIIIQLNPIYIPIAFIQNAVVNNQIRDWLSMCYMSIIILMLLYISIKVFDKLSTSFEDFI